MQRFWLLSVFLVPTALAQQPAQQIYPPFEKMTYSAGEEKVVITITEKKTEDITWVEKDEKTKEEISKATVYHISTRSGERTQTETLAVRDDGSLYRLSAAGKTLTPPICLFHPTRTEWEVKSKIKEDDVPIHAKFTRTEDQVEVPYFGGKRVAAHKVACDNFQIGKQSMKLAYWFVPGHGLVQQYIRVAPAGATPEKGFDVTMKLTAREPKVP